MQSIALPHPRLPDNLQPLDTLARDLRWTFRPSMRALFSALDPELWESTDGNPVALLWRIAPERLEAMARDRDYLGRLEAVRSELGIEDDAPPAHPAARAMQQRGDRIAYFSAEFGLTELLPVYAGGLGVLAGDHLKSASDLRLPLVGVGLFYRHGYFRQSLARSEGQRESNPAVETDLLPISFPQTPDGGPPVVVPSYPRGHGRSGCVAGDSVERITEELLELVVGDEPQRGDEPRRHDGDEHPAGHVAAVAAADDEARIQRQAGVGQRPEQLD